MRGREREREAHKIRIQQLFNSKPVSNHLKHQIEHQSIIMIITFITKSSEVVVP